MYLIGFRNRVLFIFQTLWNFLTYQRGARLITFEREAPKVKERPKQLV